MNDRDLSELLEAVRSGSVEPEKAAAMLTNLPFADLGFARVDHHRELRTGLVEAVYGPGKTPQQCALIVAELLTNGSGPVLLTRANKAQVDAALERSPHGVCTPFEIDAATTAMVTWNSNEARSERVVVVTAGTADLPVAHEAVATLSAYGFSPRLLTDCGVAGVHRLFASIDELATAEAIIVVAGMEGALASLVGGLTSCPLIAVPTSVGYGASLEGVTALLAMMASCAAGISVVGIDNGFGAACAVARILQ